MDEKSWKQNHETWLYSIRSCKKRLDLLKSDLPPMRNIQQTLRSANQDKRVINKENYRTE